MAFLDELRAQFGVAAPRQTLGVPSDVEGFTGLIGRGLQIGQGQTFEPVQPETTGLDQAISGLSPENDFLRGLFEGASLHGFRNNLLGGVRGPQQFVEPRVPERETEPGILDQLQEGFGRYLPLILGSGGAGFATGAARMAPGLFSEAGTSLGVAATGGVGAIGFRAVENILTGVAADAALGLPIPEGVLYSAAGSAAFEGLGALVRATGQAAKFALVQASDLQQNLALRRLAQEGIDPRAVDTLHDIGESLRTVDEIAGPELQLEQSINRDVLKAQPERLAQAAEDPYELANMIEDIFAEGKQFVDEIVNQNNLVDIMQTRTPGTLEAKTTASGGMRELADIDNALARVRETMGLEEYGILDRVSPTPSLDERLRVLRGGFGAFREASSRMGTPARVIQQVLDKASLRVQGGETPSQVGAYLFKSLTEQAQIGQLQGRLDVVNPNWNGIDTVAKQFFELEPAARRDIQSVLRAFELLDADKDLTQSLMAFDRRLQAFFTEFGGQGQVRPFEERPRVGGGMFPREGEFTIPSYGPASTMDILAAVARTRPLPLKTELAQTPEINVFPLASTRLVAPDATNVAGINVDRNIPRTQYTTPLLNSIPVPLDEVEAKGVRRVLFQIADSYIQSHPAIAMQAIRGLKTVDQMRPIFVEAVMRAGRELGRIEGPLGDFIRNRFSVSGAPLMFRVSLADAIEQSSFHYPEIAGEVARNMFGNDRKVSAVLTRNIRTLSGGKGISSKEVQEALTNTVSHELMHNVHMLLKNSPNLEHQQLARALEAAGQAQPWRNGDPMFRSITQARLAAPDVARWWQPPHGDSHQARIGETVADLLTHLTTPEGRRHIHPRARQILEPFGIKIEEPYKPDMEPFQFGLGDVWSRPISPSSSEGIVPPSASEEAITDPRAQLKQLGKAIKNLFPAKDPSARTTGNATVGPRGRQSLQEEAFTNAVAALTKVGRVGGGPEQQLSLFGGAAGKDVRFSKPSKARQMKIQSQLEKLGANALQAFNESLITLPRSAQENFVERFIKDGDKVLNASITDFTRALREWRASAMLFGPSTWMANIFSTMLNTLVRPLTAVTAGGIDATRSAITGAERTRFATDALAQIAGLVQGAREAVHFLRNDITRLQQQQPIPKGALQELFETGSVLRQGGFREAAFQGSDVSFLLSKGERTRGLSSTLGAGIQVPFHLLRVSDNALYNMNFTAEMYRQAANELRRQGKPFRISEVAKLVEGKAEASGRLRREAAAFAEEQLAHSFGEGFARTDGSIPVPLKALRDDMIKTALLDELPTDITAAKNVAERTIFVARETGQLDRILQQVDQTDDLVGGAISVALPFRRTPMNIIREGVRTSPLGFLTANETLGQFVGAVPQNADELVDAYAQATVGTLLYGGLTALAYYGVLEGNPEHFEQNRAKRTTYFADGRLPETVFVNTPAGKLSLPLSRLQPIGGLILGALRAAETVKDERFATLRPDILFGTQLDFIKSLGLQDQVEGTADFLEALVSDDPHLNFAERFGASFAPAFLRQGRQALGIPQGRSEGVNEANPLTRFAQGFQSGVFNSGLPRLGLFGEPIQRTPVLGAAGVATIDRDPVVSAMIDAGAFHQPPDLLPEVRDMDAQTQHSFVRGKGMLQKQFVTRVVNSPDFHRLPQDRRKRLIDAAYARASELANRRGKNALRAGATITPQLIVRGKVGL